MLITESFLKDYEDSKIKEVIWLREGKERFVEKVELEMRSRNRKCCYVPSSKNNMNRDIQTGLVHGVPGG